MLQQVADIHVATNIGTFNFVYDAVNKNSK